MKYVIKSAQNALYLENSVHNPDQYKFVPKDYAERFTLEEANEVINLSDNKYLYVEVDNINV